MEIQFHDECVAIEELFGCNELDCGDMNLQREADSFREADFELPDKWWVQESRDIEGQDQVFRSTYLEEENDVSFVHERALMEDSESDSNSWVSGVYESEPLLHKHPELELWGVELSHCNSLQHGEGSARTSHRFQDGATHRVISTFTDLLMLENGTKQEEFPKDQLDDFTSFANDDCNDVCEDFPINFGELPDYDDNIVQTNRENVLVHDTHVSTDYTNRSLNIFDAGGTPFYDSYCIQREPLQKDQPEQGSDLSLHLSEHAGEAVEDYNNPLCSVLLQCTLLQEDYVGQEQLGSSVDYEFHDDQKVQLAVSGRSPISKITELSSHTGTLDERCFKSIIPMNESDAWSSNFEDTLMKCSDERKSTLQTAQQSRRRPRAVAKKSNSTYVKKTTKRFKGVHRHSKSGLHESHIWIKEELCRQKNIVQTSITKKGKQEYLGHYKDKGIAARVHDLAALKLGFHVGQKRKYKLNFPVEEYAEEMREMQKISVKNFIWLLKRKSLGFANGKSSSYKGVHRHKGGHNRWEARVSYKRNGAKRDLYLGVHDDETTAAKAHDLAALHYHAGKKKCKTNFPPDCYPNDAVEDFFHRVRCGFYTLPENLVVEQLDLKMKCLDELDDQKEEQKN